MDPLSQTPVELFLLITRLLDFEDRKSLSATNAQLRKLLVPSIFRCIRFTNLDADEDAITHVVSQHGAHAKKLHFDFHLREDATLEPADEASDKEVLPGTILPDITAQLLSGQRLPGIASITLNFLPQNNFDGHDWGDFEGLGSIYIFEGIPDPNNLEQEEQEWPSWRRTMAQMWRVLSRNQDITSLNIAHLLAMPMSSWLERDWPPFLGRLESLRLRLWGGDNGVGWEANTASGYVDFLENIDKHFFDHTTSLKRFDLIADPNNFYGDNRDRPMVIALRPSHMPGLEELHLENCFIDQRCCDFLAAPAQRLKKLHLMDCMSNSETPTWADLFSRLLARDTLLLEELVVENQRVEVPADYDCPPHLPVVEHDPSWRLTVRSSPGENEKRPFVYGYADDKYGMIFQDEERNAERFEGGEDTNAYRRLMQLVEENVKTASAGRE